MRCVSSSTDSETRNAVNVNGLRVALQQLGFQLSVEICNQLFLKHDADRSGTIQLENLLDIFQYGIRMLHRLHDNDPAFADPSYRRSVMTATLIPRLKELLKLNQDSMEVNYH